jgi:hypothetical protein
MARNRNRKVKERMLAQARIAQMTSEDEREWQKEVAAARDRLGLDLGLISDCHQRIVAVRFDELLKKFEKKEPGAVPLNRPNQEIFHAEFDLDGIDLGSAQPSDPPKEQ